VRSPERDDVLFGFLLSLAASDELIYGRGDRLFNRHTISVCEYSKFLQRFLIKFVCGEAAEVEFHNIGGSFHSHSSTPKPRMHKKIVYLARRPSPGRICSHEHEHRIAPFLGAYMAQTNPQTSAVRIEFMESPPKTLKATLEAIPDMATNG